MKQRVRSLVQVTQELERMKLLEDQGDHYLESIEVLRISNT
jgi:hypothetical protein